MILYAGDTHGNVGALVHLENAAKEIGADIIIQAGDFGVHFAENNMAAKWFQQRKGGPIWITCGGNHDNWPFWRSLPKVDVFDGSVHELAPGCFFAERSTVLNLGGEKHIFFGGAESIDKYRRREGQDWWPEETPSYPEFCSFMDALELHKPSVVVAHDAPASVPIWKLNRTNNPTPRNLENLFRNSEHKPDRWYFGHHHICKEWDISGTRFICTGIEGDWSK